MSIQNLLPSIIAFIIIWISWFPFWLIGTWSFGKAEPSDILAPVALILSKFIHLSKWFVLPAVHQCINQYSHPTAHHSLIIYLWTKFWVKQHKDPGETYWCILSYYLLFLLFLLGSIELTITNPHSAYLFDFRVGRIDLGTFGAALTSLWSGLSGSSMQSPSSIPDSMSASQMSLLPFEFSKAPFKWSQFFVSEILSSAPDSSHWAGWRSILFSWRTFNTWVCPPGRSIAHKAGGKGDLCDYLNAAAPSCLNSYQDALTISSISEMYPMAVICLFWAWHYICVAWRFWLPCPISKKSWTLAIQFNFLSSASFFVSKSFQCSSYPMLGHHPLIYHYRFKQTALVRCFRKRYLLWCFSASQW